MNQFDDILKKRLVQEKIKLNPAHLEQFESMLDLRDRKRGGILPWMTGGFILFIILVFLWQPKSKSEDANFNNNQDTANLTSQNSTYAQALNEELKSLGTDRIQNNSSNQAPTTGSESVNTASLGTSNSSIRKPQSTNQNISFAKTNTSIAQKANSKASNLEGSSADGLIIQETLKPNTTYPQLFQKEDTSTENPVFKAEQKSEPFTPQMDNAGKVKQRAIKQLPQIIPALQPQVPMLQSLDPVLLSLGKKLPNIVPQQKFIIGLISTAGYIAKSFDNNVTPAYQLQFGGFVQRKISNHFTLGLEGGFVYNKAGIDFSKTSAVTQYGFGLRSTVNNLELKKSYFIYGGIHLQYRFKRHLLIGGMHLKYLYGAQGDIERFIEDDFGTYEEEVLENVWIKTDGLEKYSLDGLIGYGYQISPKLNVFIQARLPLKSTTNDRNQELFQDDYIIESSRTNFIPELSLRYSLFRF